jgi:hypothetical protein
MPSAENGDGGIIKNDICIWQAQFFRVRQADGTTRGFRGPELQVDVGELAIWAIGADREALTKQEAALMVLGRGGQWPTAGADGKDRWWRPTRQGLDGSGQLLVRGPGGHSEGRRSQRGRETAMVEGECGRRWPTAVTDGGDRRR